MLCNTATMLSKDVLLSVRPSVTRTPVFSQNGYKHILKRFSPAGKLVANRYSFSSPNGMAEFQWGPLTGRRMQGYEKSRFSTNISLYLGTVTC